MMQLASYPSFVLIVGLWGGPYLTHIYGYDLTGRGDILFIAALAQVVRLVLLGTERPAVRQLQGAGPDRHRHLTAPSLVLLAAGRHVAGPRCC